MGLNLPTLSAELPPVDHQLPCEACNAVPAQPAEALGDKSKEVMTQLGSCEDSAAVMEALHRGLLLAA